MVENSKQTPSESIEIPAASNVETFLETQKGMLRGDLLVRRGTERIVRPTWTYDGVGVGALIKFDAQNLARGKPLKFSVSIDNGKTWNSEQVSTPLERAGRWEKGNFLRLEDLYQQTDQHSLSENLPQNTLTPEDEEKYRTILSEYEYLQEGVAFAAANPDEAKCNFAFGSANEGWKAHINATPENVSPISEYLRQNGYAHKYLTGGAGTEGKAFTIYLGPKSMMDKWAPRLSQDLHTALSKPSVTDEVEVSSGIVARFTSLSGSSSVGGEYLQYGEYGMSARRDFIKEKGGWKNITTTEAKREVAKDAYEHLSEKYGSYFHG